MIGIPRRATQTTRSIVAAECKTCAICGNRSFIGLSSDAYLVLTLFTLFIEFMREFGF